MVNCPKESGTSEAIPLGPIQEGILMRIAGSRVNMTSNRQYLEYSEMSMRKEQLGIRNPADIFQSFGNTLQKTELNGEDSETNEVKRESGKKNIEKRGEDKLFTNYNANGGFYVDAGSKVQSRISEIENIRMQLMERILNLMQLIYGGSSSGRSGGRMQNFMRSLSNQMYGGYYQWMTVSTTTYIHTEEERTAFSAQGLAKTEDGRELIFNVNMNMSRKFTQEIGAVHMQPAELIDPLVIHVGSGVTEITDQTFTFDLDADGEKEEIKSLDSGSGFLAYDRNGDGVIGDGSELFGAISGNGFSELEVFDEDGDEWIDEDDDIYDKLRVWCRGADGKDTLMTLKEADVGAIYLGHSSTEFTSQGADFMVNGKFRESGIFLRESTGEVGMVHQVDLAKSDRNPDRETISSRL